MWYEILPTFALLGAFIAIPPYLQWGINYLTLNGKRRVRNWEEHSQDFHIYLRDRRITGSEYKPLGLEGIPDAKN